MGKGKGERERGVTGAHDILFPFSFSLFYGRVTLFCAESLFMPISTHLKASLNVALQV